MPGEEQNSGINLNNFKMSYFTRQKIFLGSMIVTWVVSYIHRRFFFIFEICFIFLFYIFKGE